VTRLTRKTKQKQKQKISKCFMAAIFYLALRMADTIGINGQQVNKTIANLRLLAQVNGDLGETIRCLFVCLVISVSNVTDIDIAVLLFAMLGINGIGSDDNLHIIRESECPS
jgi:membrane-anchored glycerophosphoryl diester phosphodiesterase (GDPDase)